MFGEVSFDVTDQFTITAGGRWFDYDRSFRQHQEQPELPNRGLTITDIVLSAVGMLLGAALIGLFVFGTLRG